MTDQMFDECISRILAGDKSGLKEIYEAYDGYIFALMSGTVRNRENAEDLTADFFIRIWQKASLYKKGSGHKAWLSTIARNMAIDYMRKAGHESLTETVPEAADEDSKTPEQQVIGQMSFKETVDLLKDPDRMIVTMKIAGQMTFKEIAQILQMPIGTVTWKYQNSLEKLRRAAV